MKYLLLGDDYKKLFVENDEQTCSFCFHPKERKWVYGGMELWDNRVGFDDSEPEGSPYRYGNDSCMREIVEITKEAAEAFIQTTIDEEVITELLNQF